MTHNLYVGMISEQTDRFAYYLDLKLEACAFTLGYISNSRAAGCETHSQCV